LFLDAKPHGQAVFFCGRGLVQRSEWRQPGRIPTSAESLDQQYARVHSAPQDVNRVPLIQQLNGLSGDNLKVRVHTALISIGKQLHSSPRFSNRILLLLRFLLQRPERCQVVFYLLKCGQHGLPVVSDSGVIIGARCIRRRAAPAGIEQRLRYGRTNRPEPAFGNVGRNVLAGPRLFEIDFSVFRRFRIGERANVEFRAESFNLTNTPHFDRPDTNFSDAAFGQVTTARGTQSVQVNENRALQFSMRLFF
jgi:hypothetical protein